MAFYPLEYLEQGKYEFVYNLNDNDYKRVVELVRNSPNRINIINGFIDNVEDNLPYFGFEIIYDIEEYKEVTFKLLNKKNIYDSLISSLPKITNILYRTEWGKEFVINNLYEIINCNENILKVILSYVFFKCDLQEQFIKKISLHPNLHVRFQFMEYLIMHYPEKLNLIYDDITKYLTSYTHQENEQLTFFPELMNYDDISRLAIIILNSKLDKTIWEKMKKFIFDNYEENDLSFLLLYDKKKKENIEEFKKDADKFFETSRNYKIEIYKRYSEFVSQEIIANFEKYINYFKIENEIDYKLHKIMYYGLWEELKKYVDKYLSLSKTDEYKFLDGGSTTSSYKIGDYVFKLNKMKWSYEDVICPNLYLILKNLEEHYVRDKEGIVLAGIEVQKYLSKKDVEITKDDIERFKIELERLGYYVADTLVGGSCGDNCMLLDSYKDADCLDPEALPDEFKKKPLVLIDRDLVYKVGVNDKKILLGKRY